MRYNTDKVDECVLALLYLTLSDDGRAWKGHDWDAMDRLYEKSFIENPKNKNKSVLLTEEGRETSKHLFERLFGD